MWPLNSVPRQGVAEVSQGQRPGATSLGLQKQPYHALSAAQLGAGWAWGSPAASSIEDPSVCSRLLGRFTEARRGSEQCGALPGTEKGLRFFLLQYGSREGQNSRPKPLLLSTAPGFSIPSLMPSDIPTPQPLSSEVLPVRSTFASVSARLPPEEHNQ